MKIRHKPPPPWYRPKPAVLDEDYVREVETHTSRLEAAYRRAERRAEAATRRLERAQAATNAHQQRRQINDLQRLVAQRQAELAELRRQMQDVPGASAQHRGRKSYRVVPPRRDRRTTNPTGGRNE